MPLRYDTITFLSDYGHADEFVGVVHSVIRSITPEAAVVDLTHDIAPHDVRAAGLLLARSAQYLCPGVVLAVVDPGVGGDRRAVAVEVGDGVSVLVGPDNGLLAPAVAMVGGATRAVELTNTDFHLPAAGATFAGRDIFAPVAAQLCQGVDLAELGERVEPGLLQPGVLPLSREEDGVVMAQVLWVDRFGNAQLNVDPDELAAFGDRVRLRFGDTTRSARLGTAYAELGPGDVGLLVDSYGLLALAVNGHSAAATLGLAEGDELTLEPLEGDDVARSAGVSTPVTLSDPTTR
jgi:S-adenosylmethionine hydrolase